MKVDKKKKVTEKDNSTDNPTLPRRETALYESGQVTEAMQQCGYS